MVYVVDLLSIMAISFLSGIFELYTHTSIPTWMAALFAGVLIGIGVTMVLNHGSSLGGIHILAVYLDQKWRVNRGLTIFLGDLSIIVVAGFLVGWSNAILSVFSILIASTIIGRYKKGTIPQETEMLEEEYSLHSQKERSLE